jgi:dTDP-4-dehydrorhamnose 3,5-epimerase
MKVVPGSLPGLVHLEPRVFGDARGFFFESHHAERYAEAGVPGPFVQDNVSRSARGVLRGLHLQHPNGQGKLVQVLEGRVFDVAVDVRVGSPTFGRWEGTWLDAERHNQLYVPPGFAHGFCVASDNAIFAYKCTTFFDADAEIGVAWDDPDLAIAWPTDAPVLSKKDLGHPRLREIPVARLPRFSAEDRAQGEAVAKAATAEA